MRLLLRQIYTNPKPNDTVDSIEECLSLNTLRPLAELVKEMKAELVALGISVAKLLPVTKEGCAFEGFDLKPSNEVTEITA